MPGFGRDSMHGLMACSTLNLVLYPLSVFRTDTMELPPSVTDTARVRQDVEAAPAPGAASATAPTQSRSTGTGDTTLGASLELTARRRPPRRPRAGAGCG